VARELVDRWAGLAELVLRVDALGVDDANLLDAAGVRSIDELAVQAPEDLTERLETAARAMGRLSADYQPAPTTPPSALVSAWVESVQDADSLIEDEAPQSIRRRQPWCRRGRSRRRQPGQ
jgi:hypothetical protein